MWLLLMFINKNLSVCEKKIPARLFIYFLGNPRDEEEDEEEILL